MYEIAHLSVYLGVSSPIELTRVTILSFLKSQFIKIRFHQEENPQMWVLDQSLGYSFQFS